MELKKSPKADLQNKRGLLLEIGLVVALALVVVAFAYTPSEHRIEKIDVNTTVVEAEVAEITRQQDPPPAPKQIEVQVISDILQIVKNDTKVTTKINFDEFDQDAEIKTIAPTVKEDVIEDDAPFITAEQMPTFQGGDLNKFRNWVQSNVKFPQIAIENNISGTVNVSFVIERDGRLTNIEVLRSPDRSLADETIRVLQKSPKWSPGKQRNQAVRVKYNLPVVFKLQN